MELFFDHPPNPEELAEIAQRQDANDPRSMMFKRILVRPKIPLRRILLFVTSTIVICAVTYISALYLFTHSLCATACVAVMACLIGVLFAKKILITMVQVYQAVAPKKVRSRCRYEPSCSVYMIQALEKYGVWRGLRKGLKRWKGCKPPNGGYDFP